jgi:hypothetical protein
MTAIIDGTNGVTTPNVLTSSSGVALTLQSGGTTAVTIDTSQNVGIGTASPGQKLEVAGNVLLSNNQYFGVKDSTGAAVGFPIYTGSNDAIFGYLASGSTGLSTYQFRTGNNVERMRIDSSGRVLVGLTSANTSGANFQVSQGVTFPATQSASSDANTLDDYEEGTWTPAYGSAFTGTYASNGQVGFYTKVGRLVTAYFWIQVSTVSGSGLLSIQGFPFSSLSSVNYSAGVVIHLASSWGTNTPFSIDGGGTSYNIKYRASSNGSIDTGNINVSDLATNAFMRATLIYFT